jgi:SAM-dependent methyltransferase
MEKYFENIKKRFDTKAIQYSGDYNKIAGFPQEKSLDRYRNINEFLKHDKSEPISRLGDIGCAAGELTRYFVGEYDEIYGVDISSECLKLLNRSCPTIKTVCANINNLPFENNFFDSLIVYSVLHYLPNWRNVAECIWGLLKILKPGGRLYVGDIEPSVVIYDENEYYIKDSINKFNDGSTYLTFTKDFFIDILKGRCSDIKFTSCLVGMCFDIEIIK